MLNDFAVGPFTFDFRNSAFDWKPAGGGVPTRFVASIATLPSRPCTLSIASDSDAPGTANSTTSASETSPPSRPSLVTSWPAFSQRSARPPPTLPLPIAVIFMVPPLVLVESKDLKPLGRARSAWPEQEIGRAQRNRGPRDYDRGRLVC